MLVKKWFVVALMIVVGFGCKKPKSTPKPVNPPDSSIPAGLSVLINNTKWIANSYTAEANWGTIPDTTLSVVAYSYTAKPQHFYLTINHWERKVGSYDYPRVVSGVPSPRFYFESDTNSLIAQYFCESGNVTIIKISGKNIQGTFNARMGNYYNDTLSFTSGMFNISY